MVGCSGSGPGPASSASCYLVEHEGFRRRVLLGCGHQRVDEFRHHLRVDAVRRVTAQRADHVRSPQFGVDWLPNVGEALPCLIQDDIGGLRWPQRREKLGDIGFRMTHAAYCCTTATGLALKSTQLSTN